MELGFLVDAIKKMIEKQGKSSQQNVFYTETSAETRPILTSNVSAKSKKQMPSKSKSVIYNNLKRL